MYSHGSLHDGSEYHEHWGVKERNNFLRAPMTLLTTYYLRWSSNCFFLRDRSRCGFHNRKAGVLITQKKNRTMQKPNLGMVNFAVLLLETPNMLLMVESLPPLCWLLNPSSLSPNVATSQDPEKHQFDESNLPTANSWHGHGLYMCNSVKSWIMYPYWGMVTNLSININIPISSHFNEDSHHGMDDHKDILRPSK